MDKQVFFIKTAKLSLSSENIYCVLARWILPSRPEIGTGWTIQSYFPGLILVGVGGQLLQGGGPIFLTTLPF